MHFYPPYRSVANGWKYTVLVLASKAKPTMPSISVKRVPKILDSAKFGSGYMAGCVRRQVRSLPLSYTTIAVMKPNH